ncbi:MAG: type II secretion system protein M [Planctomycetes bacterium]|nr:type II secretion system protein M [Planctomycetota bacterium]
MGWWAKLSQREKRLFSVAVAVIGVCFLCYFILFPAFDKIESIDNEIEKYKEDIKSDRYYLTNKEKIENDYNDFNSRIIGIIAIKDATELQRFIERNAAVRGIGVENIKEEPKSGESAISVRCDCFGTRDKMIAFLYDISTSDVPVKITKLTLSPKKEDFAATFFISLVTLKPGK